MRSVEMMVVLDLKARPKPDTTDLEIANSVIHVFLRFRAVIHELDRARLLARPIVVVIRQRKRARGGGVRNASGQDVAYPIVSIAFNVQSVRERCIGRRGAQQPIQLVVGLYVAAHERLCASTLAILVDRDPVLNDGCRYMNRTKSIQTTGISMIGPSGLDTVRRAAHAFRRELTIQVRVEGLPQHAVLSRIARVRRIRLTQPIKVTLRVVVIAHAKRALFIDALP